MSKGENEINPDVAPDQQEKQKGKKELCIDDIEEPIMDWKMYFYPANVTKIMHKKTLIFSLIAGIYYLVQFLYCCAAVNFYSDASRLAPCYNLVD